LTSGDPAPPEKEALSESERIDLHFALGKAYADIGDHARAFGHLAEGNARQRRQISFVTGICPAAR
jgi:hypothetical protein